MTIKVSKRPKINSSDWANAADFIMDELSARKRRRKDREDQWREIDRQIAMIPDESRFHDDHGVTLEEHAWRTALEVPFQAMALELLNSDARRLMFPTAPNYFSAHANTSPELLVAASTENLSGLIRGGNDPGERVTQDNIDAIVEGVHFSYQSQYDYRGVWDTLNGEAFKYGEFVGRARYVRQETFDNQFRGVIVKMKEFPRLVPMSIKDVYLDDNPQNFEFTKSVIWTFKQRLVDLQRAAMGSKEPSDINGGWIPKNLKGLDGNLVTVAEFEGDMVLPRSSGPGLFYPNVTVTAITGEVDGKPANRIVRWRENPFPFQSYVNQSYQNDDLGQPTGPLMKGRSLQAAISVMLSNMADAGFLSVNPPISYDENNPFFSATGGPIIAPGEQWRLGGATITVHNIGDIGELRAVFLDLINEYREVTGVFGPRLGAQTKSHQTAFAIDTEVERGQSRTVDYVRTVNQGAMTTYLNMEWAMIRRNYKQQTLYVPKFQSFMDVPKNILPEQVLYEVEGSGGPAEERAKEAKQAASIAGVLQIEAFRAQAGQPPKVNLDELERHILNQGFADADVFFVQPADTPGAQGQPRLQGPAAGNPPS